jgi:hypothetical protein
LLSYFKRQWVKKHFRFELLYGMNGVGLVTGIFEWTGNMAARSAVTGTNLQSGEESTLLISCLLNTFLDHF